MPSVVTIVVRSPDEVAPRGSPHEHRPSMGMALLSMFRRGVAISCKAPPARGLNCEIRDELPTALAAATPAGQAGRSGVPDTDRQGRAITGWAALSSTVSFFVRHASFIVLLGVLAPASLVRGDVATKAGEKSKERKDKDDKKEPGYLPEARNLSARFVAGHSVEIELAASVGSLKQVEFVVRQPPQHGTLSTPRPHPRESNKAIVTYTHRAADAPLADTFSYACKLAGGAWSAPGVVTLSGQRMEPRLEVLGTGTFGRVFLGDESSARLVVRNTGTMDAAIKLSLPEPWVGPSLLEVAKGSIVEFPVLFRPRKAGEFRHEVTLQPGVSSSQVIFYGQCVPPFSVSPGSLVLTQDPTTGQRSATIAVANARPEAVRAVFKLPPRLQGPSETEIAASSKTDVRLFLPADDVQAFTGELEVRAGNDVQMVRLEAKPTPGVLRLVSPVNGELSFGPVRQGSRIAREVSLANAGGEPLVVEARAVAPFVLDPPVTSLRIEPRSVAKLSVSVAPDRLGTMRGSLELTSGTMRLAVALRAEGWEAQAADEPPPQQAPPSASVGAPEPSPMPLPAVGPAMPPVDPDAEFVMRHPGQAAAMAIIGAQGLPSPGTVINPYLERVGDLRLVANSPTSVTVAWPKPSLPPSGWIVEKASVVLNSQTGVFAKVWNRHSRWDLVEAGADSVAMRVGALEPGSQYELHVMAVDREGQVSEPSRPLLVYTAQPWRVPPWFWRLLIAGALALAGYALYRVRRGDFDPAR